MGLDPATLSVIMQGVGTLAPMIANPDQPNNMMVSDPAQQAQMRGSAGQQAAQVPQPMQVPNAPPQTTPGIDIAQLIAMLSQLRGPYG